MPKALITGITGQDGSYLAEFLKAKGYEIHGLKGRSSWFNTDRVDHLYVDLRNSGAEFFLHYADLNDASSLAGPLAHIQPDEIYNPDDTRAPLGRGRRRVSIPGGVTGCDGYDGFALRKRTPATRRKPFSLHVRVSGLRPETTRGTRP
jgi:hypothetical protein